MAVIELHQKRAAGCSRPFFPLIGRLRARVLRAAAFLRDLPVCGR